MTPIETKLGEWQQSIDATGFSPRSYIIRTRDDPTGTANWHCGLHNQPTINYAPRAHPSIHATACGACLRDAEVELARELAAVEGAAFAAAGSAALAPVIERLDKIIALLEPREPQGGMGGVEQ